MRSRLAKAALALAAAAVAAFLPANAQAQTTLSAGDVAVVAVNPANLEALSIVLLRSIAINTVVHITDNGFTAGTCGRTGEGFLSYTAPSAQNAGAVVIWQNGISIAPVPWPSVSL